MRTPLKCKTSLPTIPLQVYYPTEGKGAISRHFSRRVLILQRMASKKLLPILSYHKNKKTHTILTFIKDLQKH